MAARIAGRVQGRFLRPLSACVPCALSSYALSGPSIATAEGGDDEKPSLPASYKRPAVWAPPQSVGGKFGAMNLPTAGARSTEELPRGKHDIQLYSLATPNGKKVTILLEELGVEYDAWFINIMELKQFTTGFVACNPNSKIPAMYDYADVGGADKKPVRTFESGAMLLYLAEKYGKFIPPVSEPHKRQECLNWLFWQMGTGPIQGGAFGHFFAYAPIHIEYCLDRYTMEVKRQLDVLDQHLADGRPFLVGDEMTIADIATWPWVEQLGYGSYNSGAFLDFASYKHVNAWLDRIRERPAVKRGMKVNSMSMQERHAKSDFPPADYAK